MCRRFVLIAFLLVFVYGCAATPKLSRVSDHYMVRFPDVTWTLQFPSGDLVPDTTDERPGWAYYGFMPKSMARFMEISKQGGDLKVAAKEVAAATEKLLFVSFWIDRADRCENDARKCRDMIWEEKKARHPDMQDPMLSQEGEMYLSEFSLMSKVAEGRYERHHHMYANLVRDGIWIDFHLSKAPYEEKDRQLFIDFLNSVRFVSLQ